MDIIELLKTDLVASALGIVGISLILGAITIFNKLKAKAADKVIEMAESGAPHKCKDIKASIRCDSDVRMVLSKLLVRAKAQRASVLLFHNGDVFSTLNPIWKVSTTHEVCDVGVPNMSSKFQNIKASLLNSLLIPLFTDSSSNGIEALPKSECPVTGKMCDRKTSVCRIDPDLLTPSVLQMYLSERNTKFAIMAGLEDWSGNLVGFLFVEYVEDGSLSDEEMREIGHGMCRSAASIYSLFKTVSLETSIMETAKSIKRKKYHSVR